MSGRRLLKLAYRASPPRKSRASAARRATPSSIGGRNTWWTSCPRSNSKSPWTTAWWTPWWRPSPSPPPPAKSATARSLSPPWTRLSASALAKPVPTPSEPGPRHKKGPHGGLFCVWGGGNSAGNHQLKHHLNLVAKADVVVQVLAAAGVRRPQHAHLGLLGNHWLAALVADAVNGPQLGAVGAGPAAGLGQGVRDCHLVGPSAAVLLPAGCEGDGLDYVDAGAGGGLQGLVQLVQVLEGDDQIPTGVVAGKGSAVVVVFVLRRQPQGGGHHILLADTQGSEARQGGVDAAIH